MKLELENLKALLRSAETKIVLLVLDGLGGLPREHQGMTELEAANTPNLDDLAARGMTGLHVPVAHGITPGSGPAHLALFGYDPLKYEVGRGVLSAAGLEFDLQPGDVAARGNFCTVDDQGRITDRRAGRLSTQKNRELCGLLRTIRTPGAEIFVETEKEHRFLLVLRGENLSSKVSDTDPQVTGEKPMPATALSPEASETAATVRQFTDEAAEVLKRRQPANMVLLRGFSQRPDWPQMQDIFGLRAAAIAAYPMYRGVAKLLGMQTLETGEQLDEQLDVLTRRWNDFDFFYIHYKKPDAAGEDGDFDRKVAAIEDFDRELPRVLELNPDVVIVTGDHSTPALMKYHSWHPVPVVMWSKYCRPDAVARFGERACMAGCLGSQLPAVELMPIALANAQRLKKFGA
jgi:2,3-bisphosphoglycerate-independent phosphoglycerate mutase